MNSTNPEIAVVDIIVVNWNSGNETLSAVAPYLNYRSDKLLCNVIVVDNGSSDDSGTILKNAVDIFIENPKNRGFAAACNQALAACSGAFVLFLNPDTQSSPLILERLMKKLQEDDRIGIIGPQQVSASGAILRTCGRFPTVANTIFELTALSHLFPRVFPLVPIMGEWDHTTDRYVDHVMGSYYLTRRDLINRAGLLDEDFFVYYEDIDLSKRIQELGFRCFFSSQNQIVHLTGCTGDTVMDKRLFYSFSSRRVYWEKHFGKLAARFLTGLMILELPLRLVYASLKKGRASRSDVMKAYKKFFSAQKKKDIARS